MRLVKVDVIGLEPPQRGVDRRMNVLAGQTGVIRTRTGRIVDLGTNLKPVAALTGQGIAEDGLGPSICVHVGGIEGGDAGVESGLDAGSRLLCLQLRPMRDPIAIADGRNLQTALAQMPEFHGHFPPDLPTGQCAS